MKIRRANRGSLRALCLLSTFAPPSRRWRANVAGLIKQPGAFLRMCLLVFCGGINERPNTLERQRRTPTKGRIQNTPRSMGGRRWAEDRNESAAPAIGYAVKS